LYGYAPGDRSGDGDDHHTSVGSTWTLGRYYANNVVKTVDDSGANSRWSTRVQPSSSYVTPCSNLYGGTLFGCDYAYDYYPFGAMTISRDADLGSTPIYFAADSSVSPRAGRPHGIAYLERLYVQAYNAWNWNGTSYVSATTPNLSPSNRCPAVGSGGTPWRPIFESFNNGTLWCRNYSGALGACTSTFVNSAANFSDWCGVPPIISNMRFNHSASNVTLDSGTLYNFTVTVTVDPEQMPLRSVVIRWDDGTADTELFVSDMTRNGNEYTAVVNKAYDWNNFGAGGAQQVVLNNVGVRAVDNWGWCQTTGGCTGWQPFPGTVTVRLAQ